MILRKQLNTLVTLEIVEFLVNIRYYLQYCHALLFSLTTSSSIISHKTFSIIRGLHVQIQTSIEPDYYNYIYVYIYMYIYTYIYIYIYIYIYMYMCVCMYVYMYVYICIYVCVCVYMYIYSIVSSSKLRKVLDQKQGAFTRRMKLFCYDNGVVSFVMYIYIYVYMYVCVYMCMYIYMYIFFIFICIYISYLYVYFFCVCMHIRM